MIHLLQYLQNSYTATVDCQREKFWGLTFNWKYHDEYVDMSMPGYVQKFLQKFQHQPPKLPQFKPFAAAPYVKAINGQRIYRPKLDSSSLLPLPKLQGCNKLLAFLYYVIAINITLLSDLNRISVKHDASTKQTEYQCHRVLDYVATKPNVSLIFHKIYMVFTIDSYDAYLLKPLAHNRVAGYFQLNSNNKPSNFVTGEILVECKTLRHDVASSA